MRGIRCMKKELSRVCSIVPGVWKVKVSCNCYVIDRGKEKIVIDTGARVDRNDLEMFLNKVVPFEEVTHVIVTHLHARHAGNLDVFPNARFFAVPEEIAQAKADASKLIRDEALAEKVAGVDFESALSLDVKGLKVLHTPGHTAGSCCVFLEEERILFSGDTLFANGPGHSHTPTGDMAALRESLANLVACNFKIVCPGHD